MSHSDIETHLRLERLVFTAGLDPDHRDQIAKIAHTVAWDAGVIVFREGERGSLIYIVEKGSVAIEMSVPGRGRVTLLTVGRGEVFGWSSLFSERRKTATARTVEPTTALALDSDQLREMCEADPRLGFLITRRILGVVAERLTATRMQLLDIYAS